MILVTLSLVRLECVKYIISPFETNTGSQRRYSKKLRWNLCKLNYAVSTQQTLLQHSYLTLLTKICTEFIDIPVETFIRPQQTVLQCSYLTLLTKICTDFIDIPVETFIRPITKKFLAVLLTFEVLTDNGLHLPVLAILLQLLG